MPAEAAEGEAPLDQMIQKTELHKDHIEAREAGEVSLAAVGSVNGGELFIVNPATIHRRAIIHRVTTSHITKRVITAKQVTTLRLRIILKRVTVRPVMVRSVLRATAVVMSPLELFAVTALVVFLLTQILRGHASYRQRAVQSVAITVATHSVT